MIGAIETGGTKIILALARLDGTILERERIPTKTATESLTQAAQFFRAASAQHGAIASFGIASFGPVDIDPASPDYGTIKTTPKPGWAGARYQDYLAEFGAPVVVDTDVNGAALGEWLMGAGKGCATLAYTTVGTGIGTGLVHDGKSRAGFSHYEAGHIRIPHDRIADPFPGSCPFHGDCVEGLASGTAIKARFGPALHEMPDPAAAVELIAGYLADLATSLILLHMPDRLVFGGGVMKAPGMIEALRRRTEARLGGYLSDPRLDPGLERYIVLPALGDDAGITGAIALGRQAIATTAL
jgi:fructokinase